jgi:hypothetical protein
MSDAGQGGTQHDDLSLMFPKTIVRVQRHGNGGQRAQIDYKYFVKSYLSGSHVWMVELLKLIASDGKATKQKWYRLARPRARIFSIYSSGGCLAPVGWHVFTTPGSLHRTEHLQIKGADVALLLAPGSR